MSFFQAPFSASSFLYVLPLLSTSLLNSADIKDLQPGREAAMQVCCCSFASFVLFSHAMINFSLLLSLSAFQLPSLCCQVLEAHCTSQLNPQGAAVRCVACLHVACVAR